ncbi:luciferin 4-monooxygenase-like [Pieris napi]|uniref:luciferin 4-monooxygenase-like n=1 Tax=Pieris napi TaxID=78633 RepID=UPI001FBBA229|nr:luciferin 4-monooxygenase-like [Pieris napi]
MGVQKFPHFAVHDWMTEIQTRVVAKSGKPSDRFHLGKLVLDGLRDVPEQVLQIDGGTGESETFGSALMRSIQCANVFRSKGLKKDDVIVLMAPNHIHLCIPMYAALYLGVAVAAVDFALAERELHETFKLNKPKIIFCQSERAKDVARAIQGLDCSCEIITFNTGSQYKTFSELLEQGGDVSIDEFEAEDFDPSETSSMLIPTSGTTGLPKSAEVTHKNLVFGMPFMWAQFDTFPSPVPLSIVMSPLQWYSAIFLFISCPLMRQTRLQSSEPMTKEHIYYLINKYRPSYAMSSPNMWMTLFKPGDREQCDFTSFQLILSGGSAMPQSLRDEIKKATPNTLVLNVYGMTELSGLGFLFDPTVPEAMGRPVPYYKYKLVNLETLEEIKEPNVEGEVWFKGPAVFKGYYNNEEVTAATLTKDGWMRTGDIMYRDKNYLFYFVDRFKALLKYRNNHISPIEIETLIRNHPGVFEVAVTGFPDPEHGDLPVAFVIRFDESKVTAQEIKDLVKNNLTDSKQLRGGVIFIKQLPLNASSKVDRKKLAALAKEMERE